MLFAMKSSDSLAASISSFQGGVNFKSPAWFRASVYIVVLFN
jgi:hypothetical protein